MHALGDREQHLGVVVRDSKAIRMNKRLAAGLVVINLESKGLRRTGLGTLGRLYAHFERDMVFEVRLVHRMGEDNRRKDLVYLRVGRVLVELSRSDRVFEGRRAELE